MKNMSTSVNVAMLCVVFLLAASQAEAKVNVQMKAERISPELDPVSSKKFNKDYPADKRAVVDKKYYVFGHPYPAVQDSDDFDRDYVKDENSDGGKWETQMEYDTLRAKIQAAKDKLKRLKAKMDKEYEEWMRAKKEAENYEDMLEKARRDVEAARAAADAAAKRVNDLEGRSQPDGTKAGGAIGRAIGDVKKEMDDLEKCKEALAKAKERLKKLLKEREEEKEAEEKKAKDEAAKKVKDEQEKKVKEEKEKKEKKEKVKEKKADDKTQDKNTKKEEKKVEKKEDEAENEEKAKKEVEKDTKEASSWRKNYLKELADVKNTEKQLEAAAKTLRKFRRPPYVDDNGGVYNVPDSLAMMRSPAALVMIAAAALFVAHP